MLFRSADHPDPLARGCRIQQKVLDGETGFSYIDNSADSLAGAMRRAMGVYASGPEAVARMQVAAVECIDREHTWKTVMGAYVQLYRESMRRWQD